MLKNISFIFRAIWNMYSAPWKRLSRAKVYLLAGGTDLLPALRAGAIKEGCLIDVSKAGLNYIKRQGDE